MARTARKLEEKHQDAPAEGSKKKRSRAEYTVRGKKVGEETPETMVVLRNKDDVSSFLDFIGNQHSDDWSDITIQIGKVWTQETFMNGQE